MYSSGSGWPTLRHKVLGARGRGQALPVAHLALAAPVAIAVAMVWAGCTSAGGSAISQRQAPSPMPIEAPTGPAAAAAEEALAAQRQRLVEDAIIGAGISSPPVIRALSVVPRHKFVPRRYLDQAYEDHPLPIGYGQTISQPYIVALMTEALALDEGDKVLEIGTGSGYQAAVLAEIVSDVFTIEIIGPLADRARGTLSALGYDNVALRHADGYFGWPEKAPFDAIIVTAAPDHVPPPLREQLADSGRMVIPVGPRGGFQELWLIERSGDRFKTTSLGGVAFVPLTRAEGGE